MSKHAMESLGEIYRRKLLAKILMSSLFAQGRYRRRFGARTTPYDGTPYEEASKRTQRTIHNAKKNALPPSVISELGFGIIEGRKKKLKRY